MEQEKENYRKEKETNEEEIKKLKKSDEEKQIKI